MSGWTFSGPGAMPINTSVARKDPSTNGGVRSLSASTAISASAIGPAESIAFREGYMRCGMRKSADSANGMMQVRSSDSQIEVEFTTAEAFAVLRNGTTVATSATTYGLNTWYLVEMYFKADNTTGRGVVKIDNVQVVDFTGDTLGGSDAAFNRVGFRSPAGNIFYWDDSGVNTISILYDNGNGSTPVAAETITGGTSGATATISYVEAGTGGAGTAGRLTIYSVTGTFINNETLTSSGSFIGQVNAPTVDFTNGLEPNSSWLNNGWVYLISPNANGTYSQLTGSDGNSTDNYALVDEVPVSTADYAEATSTGLKDSYNGGSLPASAISITAMSVSGFVASDLLGINNYEMLIRYDGTDYYNTVSALPSSSTLKNSIYNSAPDGSGYITIIKANAAEFGVRFTS